MANEMTQADRIEYIARQKKNYEGESVEYRQGFDHYKGDIDAMKDNPYKFRTCDAPLSKQWHQGFVAAYYVGVAQEELDTIVPITFSQVLALPRTPVADDEWTIHALLTETMFPGLDYIDHCGPNSDFYHLKVESIYENNIDGERTEDMGLISFMGEPVMLFNHSGRGGYEYSRSFILDEDRYISAIGHIRSVVGNDDDEIKRHLVSGEDDAEKLINFYGSRKEHLFNK